MNEIPGFFIFVGGLDPDHEGTPTRHPPDFYIDESGMKIGVRAYTRMALDY